MDPMEAWRIIKRDLDQLYSIRKMNTGASYSREEFQAEVVCLMALKEQEDKTCRKQTD